jgi:hypothetical protein
MVSASFSNLRIKSNCVTLMSDSLMKQFDFKADIIEKIVLKEVTNK